jgi:hypothetical protein
MVMLMILLLFVLPFQSFAGCNSTITITHHGTRVIADTTKGVEVIDCVFIDLSGGDGGAIYLIFQWDRERNTPVGFRGMDKEG